MTDLSDVLLNLVSSTGVQRPMAGTQKRIREHVAGVGVKSMFFHIPS